MKEEQEQDKLVLNWIPTVPSMPSVKPICAPSNYHAIGNYHHAGKILKSDFDGKVETMDRIVTSITSPSLPRDQTLGFSSVEHASGYNTAR